MATTQKPWGVSHRLLLTDCMQVELIQVVKHGFSSIHKHDHKDNQFWIKGGNLRVELYAPGAWEGASRYQVLAAGCSTLVPAGMPHRFWAATSVEAYEVYTLARPDSGRKVDPEDIVRYSENGVDEDAHNESSIFSPLSMSHVLCSVCQKPLMLDLGNGQVESHMRLMNGAMRVVRKEHAE